MTRHNLRAAGVLFGTLGLSAATASPAAAHVLIDRVEPGTGGETSVYFTFDHGCSGAPTSQLELTLPAGVEPRATSEPAGWNARIEGDTIDWSGPPIEDGERAEFVVTARIIGNAGDVFLFPTHQRCADGSSYHWTDSNSSASEPAPSFIGTSATVTPPSTPETGASRNQVVGAAVALALAASTVGALGARTRPDVSGSGGH